MAFADSIRSKTWTASDIATLIEGIFVSGYPLTWTDWSPTYSAGGSMTYTSVSADYANYVEVGKLVIAKFYMSGTTGNVAGTSIRLSLPRTPRSFGSAAQIMSRAYIYDGSGMQGIINIPSGGNFASVSKTDGSTYGLGAGRVGAGFVVYEAE